MLDAARLFADGQCRSTSSRSAAMMDDVDPAAGALRREDRWRQGLRVPDPPLRLVVSGRRDGAARVGGSPGVAGRAVVRRARGLPLLRRQGDARQRRGGLLAHGDQDPGAAPVDVRATGRDPSRRTGAVVRAARSEAATELLERETPVFPHYSLLEGHDRFARLPRDARSPIPAAPSRSCGFPSPVELFREIGVRDWFAATRVARGRRLREALLRRQGGAEPSDLRAAGDRSAAGGQAPGVRSGGERRPRVRGGNGRRAQLHRQLRPVAGADRESRRRGASWSRPRCSRATATSRAASIRTRARTISRRRRWSWRTRSPARSTSISSTSRSARARTASRSTCATCGRARRRSATRSRARSSPSSSRSSTRNVFDGNPRWNAIPVGEGELYRWDPESTLHPRAAVLPGPDARAGAARATSTARACWCMVGDSVTTDHISPAGDIAGGQPRRATGSSRAASRSATSTRTARAAATTW